MREAGAAVERRKFLQGLLGVWLAPGAATAGAAELAVAHLRVDGMT